ncbi:MAG: hypothetical protein JOZ78_12135 [Chroococcidiopsidaceae cyanobacterium CP_BM_ER_R8_30]|nr:hypothetical protein [Chroococcidiopsidaceae cyanobacterium CP_BM_ER_R8_30]
MNIDEFESQYRQIMDQSINQLQIAVLMLSRLPQVEANLLDARQNLQTLNQIVEEFISQQRAQ